MKILQASDTADIETIRLLFREYEGDIGVDLCFQDFAAELAQLPGAYAPPRGALFLAYDELEALAGCVALRPLPADATNSICELKRLYVRRVFRGRGLGRLLVVTVLDAARSFGYKRIRLDTLPSMQGAQRLYESLGFHDFDGDKASNGVLPGTDAPPPGAASSFAKRDMELWLSPDVPPARF